MSDEGSALVKLFKQVFNTNENYEDENLTNHLLCLDSNDENDDEYVPGTFST